MTNKQEYMQQYRQEHRAEIQANSRRFRSLHLKAERERIREWNKTPAARLSQKKYRDRIRREVIEHYGTHCVCCGENFLDALTIDHPNGDGAHHRKSLGFSGGGQAFYRWLKKQNFPEGFIVLCYTCNCMKGVGACCPHQLLSIFDLVEAATSFGREVPTRNYAGTSAR